MLIIIVALILIVVVSVCAYVRNSDGNSFMCLPLDLRSTSVNEKWVYKELMKSADLIVRQRFNSEIGSHNRFGFDVEVNNELTNIKKCIANGDKFNDEFIKFASANHSNAKNKDLYKIIMVFYENR